MSRFIMVDLETLGSTPGCSIIAIGAVACTADGWISDELYVVVSRVSCATHGLHEDPDTLDWWSRQSDEARGVLAMSDDPESAMSLPEALDELNRFVSRQPGQPLVYGNGSDFDNAILASAARAARMKLAWRFWNNACYRTIKRRTPWVAIERTGTHHNALDDARSQATHLAALLREQTFDVGTSSAVLRFVGWIADRYQERTSHSFLGIHYGGIRRCTAQDIACATYEAALMDGVLAGPPARWTQADASDLADEDMQHWEAR